MVIKPAPVNTGIRFRRVDLDSQSDILARGDHVTEVQLGTTLTNEDGASVATVEHFLAACAGILYDKPNQTRHDAPWTEERKAEVRARMADVPFLAGYAFDR